MMSSFSRKMPSAHFQANSLSQANRAQFRNSYCIVNIFKAFLSKDCFLRHLYPIHTQSIFLGVVISVSVHSRNELSNKSSTERIPDQQILFCRSSLSSVATDIILENCKEQMWWSLNLMVPSFRRKIAFSENRELQNPRKGDQIQALIFLCSFYLNNSIP